MLELGAGSEELHRTLGAQVARSGVNALWAVGKFAPHVAHAAKENGIPGPVVHADELEAVADQVCAYLRPGDALLVKGSRAMRMERLMDKLRNELSG